MITEYFWAHVSEIFRDHGRLLTMPARVVPMIASRDDGLASAASATCAAELSPMGLTMRTIPKSVARRHVLHRAIDHPERLIWLR
jgi:hypothetical protein